jgi:hypothetical protein
VSDDDGRDERERRLRRYLSDEEQWQPGADFVRLILVGLAVVIVGLPLAIGLMFLAGEIVHRLGW